MHFLFVSAEHCQFLYGILPPKKIRPAAAQAFELNTMPNFGSPKYRKNNCISNGVFLDNSI